MRHVQVIPRNQFRLYGAIVKKEIELHRRDQGTFRRSGPKYKDWAKWSHSSYPGWINIERGMGEVVLLEIRSKKKDAEWQLLRAILGFLDRHFASRLSTVNIQYES